ncbi:MAG TPA: hypothetical protein VMJ32_09075 [Pirellulales bacterium]|nr:hypothetical protein [Pirellulales bacterium]
MREASFARFVGARRGWAIARAQHATGSGPPLVTLNRKGISLLEVLISIGIMAVGMLSVAALIPVGAVQVNRANIEERKATLAHNALREFQIRGMGNIANWVRNNGGTWSAYSPLNLELPSSLAYYISFESTYPADSPVAPDFALLPPVAIDPMMLAVGHEAGQDGVVAGFPAAYSANPAANPAYAANPLGGPIMSRLGLAQFETTANNVIAPSRGLAEAVLEAGNDIITNRSDDNSRPGTNELIYTDAPKNLQPLKRDYSGQFSWLAVIMPNAPAPLSPTVVPANSFRAPQSGDGLILAIVVFSRRQLTSPVPATDQGGQEELVPVHWNTSNSDSAPDATVNIGGGEFTLTDSNATSNATGRLGMVQANQWIMLCRYSSYYAYTYQYEPRPDMLITVNVYYPWLEAKWFQVVATGEIVAPAKAQANYTRQITLAGPDWGKDPTPPPSTEFVKTQINWPSAVPENSRNFNTFAVILDGAVAVHQQTIHLGSN